MKPILFFSFQEIRDNVPYGMVKGILPLAEKLFSEKYNISYFVGNIKGECDYSYINKVSEVYTFINKVMSVLFRSWLKIDYYKYRYISELLYDFFAKKKIKEGSIIISTALLYRTLKKNKKLGGINILLAGNPDDYEIYSIYQNEKNKFGVIFNDAYSYKKRIDFVVKSTEFFDYIVTFTPVSYDSFIKRLGNDKVSLSFSPGFNSCRLFPIITITKNPCLTFCYVAHPFWLKGLQYLIEAWSSLNRDDIQLIVAGNIDPTVQSIIDRKYKDLLNVKYIGWVKDLNLFYRSSHVCIVPSLLDAGPQTILEAMYCGLPVIATEKCGYSAVIKDENNGFIVPSCCAAAIAEKIEWFANHPNQVSEMGDNAHNTIINANMHKKSSYHHILSIINNQTN